MAGLADTVSNVSTGITQIGDAISAQLQKFGVGPKQKPSVTKPGNTPAPGGSSGNMLPWVIGGAAVIGLGYVIYKKSKRRVAHNPRRKRRGRN